MTEEFIAYVGETDFHDGFVEQLLTDGNAARVTVRGYSGNYYDVIFLKVASVMAERAEGMLLYAISELNCTPPLRRFVFANSYGPVDPRETDQPDYAEATRKLEVVAEEFSIVPLGDRICH